MRRRPAAALSVIILVALVGAGPCRVVRRGIPPNEDMPVTKAGDGSAVRPAAEDRLPPYPPIRWRRSMAMGTPWAGRLVNGVRLPSEGRLYFTWDPIRKASPNRAYRRHGTDRLIRTVLRVLREHAARYPRGSRVGIGDLSRPRGGDFGPRFGGIGHASHQNGLDVDIYYPRRDGREVAPRRPDQVDRARSQDLVDRFVRSGARFVFVGPNVGLRGPPRIVQPLAHHDDHMHVRIRAAVIDRRS